MEQIAQRILELAENNLNILIPIFIIGKVIGLIFDGTIIFGAFWLLKRIYFTWAEWMKNGNSF